jgi:predicted DNA-binding WGR domain protein
LKEAGEAELSVCCIGMDAQKARHQFEREAIAEAARQGLICINKRGYSGDVSMQRFVLQSEARMLAKDLERVRAKLAKLDRAAASN